MVGLKKSKKKPPKNKKKQTKTNKTKNPPKTQPTNQTTNQPTNQPNKQTNKQTKPVTYAKISPEMLNPSPGNAEEEEVNFLPALAAYWSPKLDDYLSSPPPHP